MPDRIDASRHGATVEIEMFEVDEAKRGHGQGRRLYEQWEAALPIDITLVKIFAADTDGSGNSDGFWVALGFAYRYDGDDLTYEAAHTMVKGVNGHRTPSPIRG
jgi:predicted GNAT superfamily acetyltransferase